MTSVKAFPPWHTSGAILRTMFAAVITREALYIDDEWNCARQLGRFTHRSRYRLSAPHPMSFSEHGASGICAKPDSMKLCAQKSMVPANASA